MGFESPDGLVTGAIAHSSPSARGRTTISTPEAPPSASSCNQTGGPLSSGDRKSGEVAS